MSTSKKKRKRKKVKRIDHQIMLSALHPKAIHLRQRDSALLWIPAQRAAQTYLMSGTSFIRHHEWRVLICKQDFDAKLPCYVPSYILCMCLTSSLWFDTYYRCTLY